MTSPLKATHSPKKTRRPKAAVRIDKKGNAPNFGEATPGEVVGEQVAGRDPVVRKKVVDRDKA